MSNEYGDDFDMMKSLILLSPPWNVKVGVGIMVETIRLAMEMDVELDVMTIMEALYKGMTEMYYVPEFLAESSEDKMADMQKWVDQQIEKMNRDNGWDKEDKA